MRLLTSILVILGLTAPIVTALDPKSILLVREWDKDCKNDITGNDGLTMIRGNHPCSSLSRTREMNSYYQSSFDVSSKNLTITHYNIPSAAANDFGKCNQTYAATNNYTITYTNIPLRTCVKGLGYSFDWDPADRYIGYFGTYSSSNCTAELEPTTNGNAIQRERCVEDSGSRTKKFHEWSNGTVSECIVNNINATCSSISNAICGDSNSNIPGAFKFDQCLPNTKSNSTSYVYWVQFGGPTTNSSTASTSSTAASSTAVSSTAASSTAASSTAASSTAVSSTGASSTGASSTGASSTGGPTPTNPPSTPSPTTPKPSGANLVAHTSIFTLIACIGVVLGAQL